MGCSAGRYRGQRNLLQKLSSKRNHKLTTLDLFSWIDQLQRRRLHWLFPIRVIHFVGVNVEGGYMLLGEDADLPDPGLLTS